MKKPFKIVLYAICLAIVSPFAALVVATGSLSLFRMIGQVLSMLPDGPGTLLRAAYYFIALDKCPISTVICFGTFFTKRNVEIGSGVYIGGNCNIGMCKIHDNATIASGVCILSGKTQHGYKEIGIPIQQQSGSYQQIVIGENCWIGHGAIVMANLGKQNIVASGAVITKDTKDYEIWAGNPAKMIKDLLKEPIQSRQ